MDNDEFHNNDSDEEISEKHSQLLKFVEKLDKGQRIKRPERSEPTLQVSEFHLVNSGITNDDAVCVDELVKTLGDRTHYTDISKKFAATKRVVSLLPKPLEKPAADKLKRAVGFENTTKELEKWNAIVTRNRVAPTQIFPLQQPLLPSKPDELVKRFRIQSELEKELMALEPKESNENSGKENEFALTLEEMVQKRLEAAKFRAQQSYKQAKAHRQKKIKSKKFHRIARNAKVKEQFNEFVKLQQVDPQAALEKLEELNKARAEERMSLKHKNTSQWAKNKQIRAKYDKESRGALAQQLSISRELMQKVKKHDNSDDDVVENEIEALELIASTKNNPWVNNAKTPSEIDEFVLGYRKYWEKIHEANTKKQVGEMEENGQFASKKIESLTDTLLTQQDVNIEEKHPNDDISTCKIKKQKKDNRVTISKFNNVKSSEDQLVSKEKMTSKSVSKNINSVMTKAGTSEWSIEILDNSVQSMNNSSDKSLAIDNIFDAIDDSIKQKIKKKIKRVKHKLSEVPVKKLKSTNNQDDPTTDLSFNRMKQRPDLDERLDETIVGKYKQHNSAFSIIDECITNSNTLREGSSTSTNSKVEIDPNKFINVESKYSKNKVNNDYGTKKGDQVLKHDEEGNEEEEDEEEGMECNINQQNIISEAFAEDDIVDEFRREKADEAKKLQLENIDMRLPGWGAWGGNNIKNPLKKKRRFILKFPQNSSINEENKGDVVIIQDNSIVKKHQVNDLPHPFSSVSDFETSIRAPIGRNFIPENSHKRLIAPTIRTRMGKVIKPMGEDVLIKKNNIDIDGKLLRHSKKKNATTKNSTIK